jgi:excisionase family DNA binding protein
LGWALGRKDVEKTEQQTDKNAVTVSPEFFNIQDLSRYLGIKTSTLYAMVREKKIPHYKFRRLIRFKRSEIEHWVEGNRKECLAPEESARKKPTFTPHKNLDVDWIAKKAIEDVLGKGYTDRRGRTRPNQGPRKGGL